MRLADVLIEMGRIEKPQLETLLAENPELTSTRDIGDLLIGRAWLSEKDFLRSCSQLYDLDFLANIDHARLDSNLVEKLPIGWARSHCVLPIPLEDEVAMLTADPEAADEEKYLSLLLRRELVPVLAPPEEIRSAIEACYVGREGGREEIMAGLDAALDAEPPQFESSSESDLLSKVDNAPVTQLVNLILIEAVKSGASDIHIEPYEKHLQLRYRIDGVLYEQPAPPNHLQNALVSRLKVMAHLDIAEKRLPQDGMAKVRVGESEIDIRVSTVPVAAGERIVLRILSRQSVLMPMNSLGMSKGLLDTFSGLLREPQGIILVTGPTGSGKTTTLYAGLQQLDTERLNVITIEDPIEYQLDAISQIQVKPRIGLGFAEGLRHILRQDPDAILVGEIRDSETAEIAIRSSLTGHLVLSTLHTNDAVSTPLRIIDMGIKPYLLSESLRAVIAQRLVRRLCPECRAEQEWTRENLNQLPDSIPAPEDGSRHWRATGCGQCRDGYRGRVGIFECLLVEGPVKEGIRNEVGTSELSELASRNGMETIWHDALQKIVSGATSLDETTRVLGRIQ